MGAARFLTAVAAMDGSGGGPRLTVAMAATAGAHSLGRQRRALLSSSLEVGEGNNDNDDYNDDKDNDGGGGSGGVGGALRGGSG